MTETVLVTGGSGFVAGWCIVSLLRRGYTVRATLRDLGKEQRVRASIAAAADAGERLSFVVADLSADAGWDAAMVGCDYVLHVASPLGDENPNAAEALVGPARDGTLRVLRAAITAGVKRVVMTSSTAAATPSQTDDDTPSNETVWTDPDAPNSSAYRRSKLIAERAAWAFMANSGGATKLTTVLPTAVFGPLLPQQSSGSVRVLARLIAGQMPGLPRLGFNIVDVRDLADLHVDAMIAPLASGERFIATGDFLWMDEIARELRSRLGDRAQKIPTRRLPSFLVRFLSLFVPSLRTITPLLDRKLRFSAAKARRVLGFTSRPALTTIVDCSESILAASSGSF